jgi:hypothetical protein
MAAMDFAVAVYRFNLVRIRLLTHDLADAQLALQPQGVNHPAWILGHLSCTREWLKDALKLPERKGWNVAEWMAKFNRGSQIVPERSQYPTKAVLLEALETTHREIEAGALAMSAADLARELTDERIRTMFPNVGTMVTGLMTTHEAFHMGQLSAWRRAMGMKLLF